ncbi:MULTISPECIES: hypothetical protein [unclassified Microcoleus]|uniref:hypothetical protein n=1 Tax=unclassified Microcoleus TaxID=2642155 RepID=UPI002FD1A427
MKLLYFKINGTATAVSSTAYNLPVMAFGERIGSALRGGGVKMLFEGAAQNNIFLGKNLMPKSVVGEVPLAVAHGCGVSPFLYRLVSGAFRLKHKPSSTTKSCIE